ncbi:MAG: CoA-binding protein [Deltaproteobacteria bacterium RBG_16_50_11]|nr:MAG: CoA-binding protein [Deltaproteobacteria bacterium RBG_16_50_11]
MDLGPLFRPKPLAVIGISLTNEKHPANVVYNKNHLRLKAKVFPVNERGGVLFGEKIYPTVLGVPEKIDLAVIATRAEVVPKIMKDCIEAGVKGAIVISGGFAERGRKDLQDDIVSMAREGNLPFIGPNCLGIYFPPYIDTFFIPGERMVRPEKGNVALISQSGGVLVDYMVKLAGEGVGVSAAVSIGNKALIRELDLLNYFAEDPETGVIAFYIEGFGEKEGREFVLNAGECPKPVIVLKSGKTATGTQAVSSHSASIAGDYEVFSSALSQYGVVEAKDEFEMVSFCEALSCYHKPIEGNIGIISGSGGHGAIAVDTCISHGLSVPTLPEEGQQEVKVKISPRIQEIASLTNPIDLTGSAVDDDFLIAATFLSRRPEVDCILILLLPYIPGMSSDLGARLSQVYRQERKPIIAYVPHVEKFRMFIEGFQLNEIPVAHSVEEAVHMAEALRRHQPC